MTAGGGAVAADGQAWSAGLTDFTGLRYGELVERRAERQPDRPAILSADGTLTYGRLAERIRAAAVELDGLGVRAGDRVVCVSENRVEILVALYACSRIGAIFTPVAITAPIPDVEHVVGDLDATLVLASARAMTVAHAATEGTPQVRVVGLEHEPGAARPSLPTEAGDAVVPEVRPTPGTPAVVVYTSGTGGRPKGVVLTHGAMFFNGVNTLLSLDVGGDEVHLVTTPLSHIAALNSLMLATLHKGGLVVLERRFEAERCLRLIAEHGVTSMFAVPSMLTMMAQLPGFDDADLTSLRFVMGGGAPMPDEMVRLYGARGVDVLPSYGMTEAGPSVTFRTRRDAQTKVPSSGAPALLTDVRIVEHPLASAAAEEATSQGTAAPDSAVGGDLHAVASRATAAQETSVHGARGEVLGLPPGEVGEIIVRAPHTSLQYWRNPEATAETFVDGWLITGDRGLLDAEGDLHVTGRSKDLIISGGENVDPAEVEHLVATYPGVREAAVIGRPDEMWGEIVTAVVVADGDVELDALRDYLRPHLAPYKLPRAVERRADLPRSAVGKLLRREL